MLREEEERKARLLRQQEERDTAVTTPYQEEIVIFLEALPQRMRLRQEEADRVAREKEQRQKMVQRTASWMSAGRCQYCGGEFKGVFGKKCAACGKPKDY